MPSALLLLGMLAVSIQPVAAQQASPVQLVRSPLGAVTALPSPHAGEFVVPLNKSQILRVDQSFEEITVGNAEIADVVPLTGRQIYVLGKQLGTTNLTVLGAEGRVIAVVDLVVAFDTEALKAKLFELLPSERIEVRPAGDAIVLSGQVSSPGALANALSVANRYAPDRVTNLLTVGGSQQVMLQVRFAEVSRTAAKQLGISSALLAGDTTQFLFDSGTFPTPGTFATGILSLIKSNYALAVALEALEEKGAVKTLAEPNLIVLSGDTASFLAGGEFPIPVAQEGTEGGFVITIEFKEFGVSLSFTPTVVGDGLINLVLNTEVSALDRANAVQASGINIPALTSRRARTSVELRDGQSFAIAGLLQDDFTDTVRQLPILGDIPILGALLRSTEFQRRQTELVVIVTPHLVQPAVPTALRSPTDTFRLPTEAELFLLGRLEGSPGGLLGAQSAGGIDGPHGYILK